MTTFKEHRRAALSEIELMMSPANPLTAEADDEGDDEGDEPRGNAGKEYKAKGSLALEIARNLHSGLVQWLEAVELLKRCHSLATEAEYEISEEAADEEHQAEIENDCEWARNAADTAAAKATVVAAWLQGDDEARRAASSTAFH